MKIYTKTGDNGKTSLFNGERVGKSDARVHAYGEVDELNAHIGHLYDILDDDFSEERAILLKIQHLLFTIGGLLANPKIEEASSNGLELEDVEELEQCMDKWHNQLPALRAFILPSGHKLVSCCHICRTICRRAERSIVSSSQGLPKDEMIVKYINRLSDFLFVLARYIAMKLGVAENHWEKE